jgi:hypothetical protein
VPRAPLLSGKTALFLLLCGSVALNGVLLARAPAPAATPPAAPTSPRAEDGGAPAPATPPPRMPWPTFGAIPRAAVDGGMPARPAPSGPVDVTLQQDVLCTLAEDRMRAQFRGERERIVADLRRSFADADEQARNVTENAARLANAMDLGVDRRAAFTSRYRERRLARIAEAAAALAHTPPDYAGLYAAARGLFADEDALALELGGEAARERLRVEELQGRTDLLAIGAAMADAPFESLGW